MKRRKAWRTELPEGPGKLAERIACPSLDFPRTGHGDPYARLEEKFAELVRCCLQVVFAVMESS